MIFEDNKFESEFDFGSSKKLVLTDSPYKQLASAILNTIQKIEDSFRNDENAKIYYYHVFEEFDIEYLKIENAKESPTYKDIYDQVQRSDRERIQGILESMGVIKPDEKDEGNFILYLKLEYLFYFMRYYIFPKEKFYDLYKKELKTMETVLGENAKYANFIFANLRDEVPNTREKLTIESIKQGYDWNYYMSLIMSGYQETILLLAKEGSVFDNAVFWGNFEKTLNISIDDYKENDFKAFLDLAESYFHLKMKRIKNKFKIWGTDNPVNELVDYIFDFGMSAVISDYRIYFNKYFGNHCEKRPQMPRSFANKRIYFDEMESFIESDEFLNWLDSSKKLTKTKRRVVRESNALDILECIWNLAAQYFSEIFMQDKSGNMYITADIIAPLAWTIIRIEKSDIYYARSINLRDRKESLKSSVRPIRNEFRYYSHNGTWRGNMEMPMALFFLLVGKSIIELVEEGESLNIASFIIELLARCFIAIEDELTESSVIYRYMYIRELYKQLKRDMGNTP